MLAVVHAEGMMIVNLLYPLRFTTPESVPFLAIVAVVEVISLPYATAFTRSAILGHPRISTLIVLSALWFTGLPAVPDLSLMYLAIPSCGDNVSSAYAPFAATVTLNSVPFCDITFENVPLGESEARNVITADVQAAGIRIIKEVLPWVSIIFD